MRLIPGILVTLALVLSSVACSSDDGSTGIVETDFRLTSSGFGDFVVGDPYELVSADLNRRFGGADVDSFDATTEVFVPQCRGQITRLESWGNFIVLYTGTTDDLGLATWTYGFDPVTGSSNDTRGLELRTDADIGLGATRDEIIAAYGAEVSFSFSEALGGETVTIGDTDRSHLVGTVREGLILLELAPTCG
jgi:hypothetical protein